MHALHALPLVRPVQYACGMVKLMQHGGCIQDWADTLKLCLERSMCLIATQALLASVRNKQGLHGNLISFGFTLQMAFLMADLQMCSAPGLL